MQERYSHGHDDSVLNSYRSRSAANSAAYLLPHLKADMRLLDVGCGPGSISADFADVLAQGQVTQWMCRPIPLQQRKQGMRATICSFKLRACMSCRLSTPALMWCMPTKCCNTWPTPSAPCAKWRGY